MGTEDWVLKGTKLITNTKSKDYKSLVEVNSEKYNIKNTKQNKSHKHKNVYMKFALKNRVFFFSK